MSMQSTLARARRIASLPPHELASKVLGRLKRFGAPLRDLTRTTYLAERMAPAGDLLGLLGSSPPEDNPAWLNPVVDRLLEHRFCLLGSGWVQVHHGMSAQGLEGTVFQRGSRPRFDREGRWLDAHATAANRASARRIWQMVDAGYEPVDWHVDFRSGYRWPPYRHYSAIRYGNIPGVDVKVPWELARCQHHIWLARAYSAARDREDVSRAERIRREFRNQVLDFVASNPPRHGVNWTMAMDVAIRAANWLLALDMLQARGARFDAGFLSVLKVSIYQHGLHVLENLEWSPTLRSNHYLANVVGLLFIAAYLPRNVRVDAWLAFAVQELQREVLTQFGADGGNFEASTGYHRLSCEMAIYGTAIILGLPQSKQAALREFDTREHRRQPALEQLPQQPSLWLGGEAGVLSDAYFDRLRQAVAFTRGIVRPDGRVPQIGDADSGRFFKVSPAFLDGATSGEPAAMPPGPHGSWREDFLDHRHVLAAYEGVFAGGVEPAPGSVHAFETDLVIALGGGRRRRAPQRAARSAAPLPQNVTRPVRADTARELVVEVVWTGISPEPVRCAAFPAFGLYVMQTSRVHVTVRCGPIGQNGVGGHAHNDQLAFELAVDGRLIFADRGSYLYTPSPYWRNYFRSTMSHTTINASEMEQNEWWPGPRGLFSLKQDRAQARVEDFGSGIFCGSHSGFGAPVRRSVQVLHDRLRLVDRGQGISSRFCLAPGLVPTPGGGGEIRLAVPAAAADRPNQLRLLLADPGGRWEIREAWYSAAYGEKVRCFDVIAFPGAGG